MEEPSPFTVVLLASSLAAAVSALGVLPFRRHGEIEGAWTGIAQALASGFMLGIGYLLLFKGLALATLPAIAGSLLGIGYTVSVQGLVGIRDLHRVSPRSDDPSLGYRALLQSTLHSASEGIAIGVSMALSLELGLFMAGALALHNIGESMALAQVLQPNRLSLPQLGALAVMSKTSQVLLALLALALVGNLGDPLTLMLGFAAGSLLYLVLTELLPAAYQSAPS